MACASPVRTVRRRAGTARPAPAPGRGTPRGSAGSPERGDNSQCTMLTSRIQEKGTDRVIASANYGHEPCEPPQIVYMCVNMEPSPCLRAHEGAKTLEKVGFLPPFFNSPQPFCSRD